MFPDLDRSTCLAVHTPSLVCGEATAYKSSLNAKALPCNSRTSIASKPVMYDCVTTSQGACRCRAQSWPSHLQHVLLKSERLYEELRATVIQPGTCGRRA